MSRQARFLPLLVMGLATPASLCSPPTGSAAPAHSYQPAGTPSVCARTRVYILDGVNPFGRAGVEELADHLRGAGFPRTRVGGWYSGAGFEREIRATFASDPTARFAVIGYSAGSYTARALADRLLRSGVPVAVVGYVGGDYLRDTPQTQASGAGRVVNVTGDGYLLTGRNLLFNGTEVTGAANLRLAGTSHFGLPTDPRTFAALYAALVAEDGY